jgi:hypothetical protein
MNKPLALLTLIAALAAPLSAQAHRAWMAPTSTTLSGTEGWIGVDAGMSNGVFIADHAAMRLDGLVITAPDGSTVQPANMMQGRYRSTFDVHLTQAGTYKIANVMGGVNATYTLDGEQKRWRGSAAEFPAALPPGATGVQATRSANRVETFVTLGAPTETVFTPTGEGVELVPVTHPTDLVAGEAGSFRLLNDGRPAANVEVTVARGGSRYRDAPEEITMTTDAEGTFSVTWPQAGMYWISAAVRTPAAGDQLAMNAQYNGAVEVLP